MGEDPLSWSHGPVGLSEETHRPVSQGECDSGWTEFINGFSETLVYIYLSGKFWEKVMVATYSLV